MKTEDAISGNPLGISLRCLIAWITFSAVLLAFNRPRSQADETHSDPFRHFEVLLAVDRTLNSLTYGLVITGILVLGFRIASRRPALLHPGHWLLTIEGTSGAIRLALISVFDHFTNAEINTTPVLVGIFATFAVASIVLLACGLFTSMEKLWRWLLFACAVSNFLAATHVAAIVWTPIPLPGTEQQQDIIASAFVIMALSVLLITEKFRKQRDWLHYLGILFVAWNAIMKVIWIAILNWLERN